MAITQAIANSFKKQLLDGDHDFTAALVVIFLK